MQISKSNFYFYSFVAGSNLLDGIIKVLVPLTAAVNGTDAFTIGILSFFSLLPWIISPLIGVVVDRLGAGETLIFTAIIRPFLIGIFPLIFWYFGTSYPVLIVWIFLVLVNSFIDIFNDISIQSYSSKIVSEKELEKLFGKIFTFQTVCGSLIPPVLAGFLVDYPLMVIITFISISGLFLVPSVLKATSTKLLSFIVSRRHAKILERKKFDENSFWKDSIQGFKIIWEDSWLRRSAFVVGALNIANSATSAVAIVYLVQVLNFSAPALGLVFSMVGIGAAIGGMLSSHYSAKIGFSRSVILGSICFIINGLAPLVGVSIFSIGFVWVISSLGIPFFSTSVISHRQKGYDSSVIGRLNGAFQLIGIGIAPVGGLLGGFISVAIGLVPVLWATAILIAIVIVIGRPWKISI